jgi:hypothetical protein
MVSALFFFAFQHQHHLQKDINRKMCGIALIFSSVLPHDFKSHHGCGGSGGEGTAEVPSVINPHNLIRLFQQLSGDPSFFSADHQ